MGDFFKNLVYQKEDMITFSAGIPGFEHCKEFVIVSIDAYAPFEWLVCVDGSNLRFAIINPLLFMPDYSPSITKTELEELDIPKIEDLLLYVIVTINVDPLLSTANLVGPILVNRLKKIGKQIILENDRYTTQEPILRKN